MAKLDRKWGLTKTSPRRAGLASLAVQGHHTRDNEDTRRPDCRYNGPSPWLCSNVLLQLQRPNSGRSCTLARKFNESR